MDGWAFEEIYVAYTQRVHAFCRSFVPTAQEAEDLTSEVFVRLWRLWPRLKWNSEAHLRSYLLTTAHHLAIDRARRVRARPVAVSDSALLQVTAAPEPGPEEQLIATASRAAAITLLRQLTPAQRQVLQLRILDELTIRDTAARVGRPETAVKKLQCRGLAALRSTVQRHAA